MIPQIKELIEEYDIDGMWVDGDCWAVMRDYSENAKNIFGKASPRKNTMK